MPYCPRCGKEVLATDQFCLNCGQRLERLYSQSEPPATSSQLAPPVPAMNASNLYLIGEQGLLKIGTWFPLIAVTIGLGIFLGLTLAIVSGLDGVSLSVVSCLIIAPIIGEVRARRLAGLARQSYEELASKAGIHTIPWSSIDVMRVTGRKLAFKTNRGWVSSTVETADAERLGNRAPAILGEKFARTPEQPPRFSPLTKFLLLTAVILVASELILAAASLSPFLVGEQSHYTTLYNDTEASLGSTVYQQWWAIFQNNVQVALYGFVPALGSFFLAFSSYNTGRIIQVIGVLNHISPSDVLFVLFILPHTWVEELSYPLAAALGYYSFTWRHQSYAEFSNWKTRASTKVTLGFAVVALIIAIAATLEVSEPSLGLGALLLWVPVVIGAFYAYMKLKSRIAAALS